MPLSGIAEPVHNAGDGCHNTLRLRFSMPLAGNRLKEVNLLWRTKADNKGGHYAVQNIPSEAWREIEEGKTFVYEWTELQPSTTYQVRMQAVQKRTGNTYETPHNKMTGMQTKPQPQMNSTSKTPSCGRSDGDNGNISGKKREREHDKTFVTTTTTTTTVITTTTKKQS